MMTRISSLNIALLATTILLMLGCMSTDQKIIYVDSNAVITTGITTDLGAKQRIINRVVDLGAYENYLRGNLADHELPQEQIDAALKDLEQLPKPRQAQ